MAEMRIWKIMDLSTLMMSLRSRMLILRISTTIPKRADASTDWKEFTAADGRKYYYNKVTKQSKWTMPDELKLAREQSEKTATQLPPVEIGTTAPSVASTIPSTETSCMSTSLPTATEEKKTKLIYQIFTHLQIQILILFLLLQLLNILLLLWILQPLRSRAIKTTHPSQIPWVCMVKLFRKRRNPKNPHLLLGKTMLGHLMIKHLMNKLMLISWRQKNAFKALLESANVQSDWTWEQAMRVIINDKRYGSLRTLGERKQAFNEYLGQRKKQETEERRVKQKKAREDFVKMLEECKDLTSSTRWSKAIIKFEDAIKNETVDLERIPIVEVFEQLKCSREGLSAQEGANRLQIFGPNKLEEKKESKVLKFLGFMWNPLSWVMEMAAIMAIALALVINSTISFIEENNAGNAQQP